MVLGQQDAKEWLRQVKKLDILIRNKLIEKEQWWAIATGIVSVPSGDRVQSSGSQQKMADAANRYIDIERDIDRRIDEYVNIKQEIIETIEQLPTDDYDILHKHYIQGFTLYEIAEQKDMSYSNITTIHGRALAKVQKILDRREAKAINELLV